MEAIKVSFKNSKKPVCSLGWNNHPEKEDRRLSQPEEDKKRVNQEVASLSINKGSNPYTASGYL